MTLRSSRALPAASRCRVQHGELVVEHLEGGRQVAAVTQPGGDRQRAALAVAADDDGDPAGGPRIAGRLGQADPVAGVRLGAGRPQCPHRLDGGLQRVEPLTSGWERQPEGRVLPLPPARADADERPSAGQRVERRRRLGRDAGGPEGDRRDQRAQPQAGVQAGDQPERDPRLGDRLPGPVDLRDLDQVVHQRQPAEPGLVGGQRHRPQPPCRVLAPGEARQLQHDLQPLGRDAVLGRRPARSRVSARQSRRASGATTWTRSHPSASISPRTSRNRRRWVVSADAGTA